MKTLRRIHAVLAGSTLAIVLGAGSAVAGARDTDLPQLSASPIPTPTPIANLDTPPLSVASPDASSACANDEFLAYRAVPQPWEIEVTACGSVIAVPAGLTRGGPTPAFALDVDGTPPLAVIGAIHANIGDTAVVHGRYHRDKSGGEWIDHITQAVSREWSHPGFVILNGTTVQ